MRAAKQHKLPALTLCKPFVTSASLPNLRKQACSVKDQADPMESLLGAIALAAVKTAPHADPLATALQASFGFFCNFILPSPPAPPSASTSHLPPSSPSVTDMLAGLAKDFEWLSGESHTPAIVELACRLQAVLNDTMRPGGAPINFEAVQSMLREWEGRLCRLGDDAGQMGQFRESLARKDAKISVLDEKLQQQ